MDALPWPSVTVATLGYVLFGWVAWTVLRAVIRGDLVPRREVDAKDREIAHLRQANVEQGRQLSLLQDEALPTTVHVLKALHAAAEEAE